MVGVEARCSFEVVSSVSGKFGDPYSTQVPSSSVFEGSLARNGGWEASLEGLVLLAGHARFLELCPFRVAGVALSGHFEV